MPAKKVYSYSESPEVSVVIPTFDGSRGGNVTRLIERFKSQDFRNLEIILSIAESPNGHSRNVGYSASARTSQYFLFFDDDVDFEDFRMVSKLVEALSCNPTYGLVGALIKRPLSQNSKFVRWIEREGGRHVAADISEYTESTMVCHAGLAIRREVWEKVGGESSTIPTGTDTDLRLRVKAAGYKVILVPNTKVYHPFPESAGEMWRRSWMHGVKHIWFRQVHPDALNEACPLVDSRYKAYALIVISALKLVPSIFVSKRLRLRFTPILSVDAFLFHLGYAVGWLRANTASNKDKK